jgi:hypothetical protein
MWHPGPPGPLCEGGRKHAALQRGCVVAMHSVQHSSFVAIVAVRLCFMSAPRSPVPAIHVQLPGGAGGTGDGGGGSGEGGGGGGGGGDALLGDVRTTSNDAWGASSADICMPVMLGMSVREIALRTWQPFAQDPSPGTSERFSATVAAVRRLLINSTAAAERPHPDALACTGRVLE